MDANESCIDMEVGSLTTIFSPSHHKEFEFQSFSCSSGRDTTTSPADELFYRGKLLPLNLPPCLQKVEKILHNSYSSTTFEPLQESLFSTPIFTPASNTPFESCHISPADSCQVSRELNPDEYFLEYSTDQSSTYVFEEKLANSNTNKSWTKPLKLFKQSTLGSKLKASRAYLKSLFNKSSCSVESSRNIVYEGSISKAKKCALQDSKTSKNIPSGQIHTKCHRKSFSGAIKRTSKEMKFLKRSISGKSEFENSIQAAIAHCKRSHQQEICSRKTVSDHGFLSMSASRVIFDDQERPELCKGCRRR
ncbi:probable membrane-associated kinase regulator 4 isoform X2 [Olea europaea var. sylvestris]|uniref:probable membrane-associated kinase regulator 4 isoform X2 n=1 Tax=Olea europaea var. sylvestris TaxID=158386 RepID=UPI000C1CE1B8|nr:probable membrane-associated kinase regulator 4 isoform X2 [Olea europaea var. sylvestris]